MRIVKAVCIACNLLLLITTLFPFLQPVLMEASSNIKPIYTLSGASQATTEMHGYTQSGVSQPTLQTATSAQGQQQAQGTLIWQNW